MQIRWRAVILGLVLVPINCVWLSQMEMATRYSGAGTGGPYPTTFSLFANVVVLLLVLRALNELVKRVKPEWALSFGEMMVVYTMLCVASAVDAIDFIDVLVPMITHLHRYDDASAGHPYAEEILRYLPSYFTLNDSQALKAWHEGRPELFWTMRTLLAWLPPYAVWGAVICVMLGVMLCLSALLRVKWIDQERLTYPIVQIPVRIASAEAGLFSAKLFWLGFGIAASISVLNGLAVFWPMLPVIKVKLWDLSPHFAGRPWDAMGWTPVSFYPFGIGLGYMLPQDLLFSTWFFFWLLKAERVMASATGFLSYDAHAPYVEQQCFGAYIYMAVFGLWMGRKYFLGALGEVFSGGRDARDGPIPRHLAVSGALLGMVALGLFFANAGMSAWLVIAAWLIYWLISLSVTRMRAELGPPAHDLHQGGPDAMLPIMLGTRLMGPRNLNLLTWFYWFNRAYRSHPMPHMLEGFFLARRHGFSEGRLAVAIALAGVLGVVSTFAALTYFGYRGGAEATMAGHATGFGWEAFNRLEGWLGNPTGPNLPSMGGAAAGLLLAMGMHRMTLQYIWWPLHPLGFAIAGSYSMSTMWCPMMIAWIAKTTLMRYGGNRAYIAAVPFFVGLLVGDYALGCLWPIVGWILGKSVYSFQQ